MSAAAFLLIPAGAAVAVAATTGAGAGTPNTTALPTNATPNGGTKSGASGIQSGGGAAPGATIHDLLTTNVSIGTATAVPTQWTKMSGFARSIAQVAAEIPPLSTINEEVQEKLDEVEKYGEAAYDNLDKETRNAAASAINEEYGTDLKGDEDWATLGATVGGVAAGAACTATGVGAVFTPLCIIVGTYLGGVLGDLIQKNREEIKAWFKARWADIETWVNNAVKDVEKEVNKVISWFDQTF